MQLVVLPDQSGRIVIYRVSPLVTPECQRAFQVMNRIPGMRIARDGEYPPETGFIFTTGLPDRTRQ
jgi:hypothetical protein